MSAPLSLSADVLLGVVRAEFEHVPDERAENASLALADALMSGYALFALKDPSLLAFDARRTTDRNLHTIFKIGQVPSDTQMRSLVGRGGAGRPAPGVPAGPSRVSGAGPIASLWVSGGELFGVLGWHRLL